MIPAQDVLLQEIAEPQAALCRVRSADNLARTLCASRVYVGPSKPADGRAKRCSSIESPVLEPEVLPGVAERGAFVHCSQGCWHVAVVTGRRT